MVKALHEPMAIGSMLWMPTRGSGGAREPLNPAGTRGARGGVSKDRSAPDRRNLAARQRLLQRIVMEYREMPGLCLTLPQAQRLFGLRGDVCVRLLDMLVRDGLLRRTVERCYARADVRP